MCPMTSTLTTKNNKFLKGLMKIIFPSVKKAGRSAVCAICEHCEKFFWFGPPIFDVYGKPRQKRLRIDKQEFGLVLQKTEDLYKSLL